MSLKAFHILFIIVSIILAVGCAWWAFATGASPIFGIGSGVVAVGLVIYGIIFLKKSKKLIL